MFVGVGAVFYAASQVMERKRREAYEQYALTHGLVFDPEAAAPQRDVGAQFPLFQLGHSQVFRYALKGTRSGVPFTAFEFKYVTGGGRSSQTHCLALMAWWLSDAGLPNFYVGPEGWWDRIKQRFGAQDFDYPEDGAFSDEYVLQGGDEAAVRKLFDGAKRAFLVAHPGTHAAGTGRCLLWWRVQRLPSPGDKLEAFFSDGDGFCRVFST